MSKASTKTAKPKGKSLTVRIKMRDDVRHRFKKTEDGASMNTKRHNVRSKKYRKPYVGQGR